jgi:hypothetical protein
MKNINNIIQVKKNNIAESDVDLFFWFFLELWITIIYITFIAKLKKTVIFFKLPLFVCLFV